MTLSLTPGAHIVPDSAFDSIDSDASWGKRQGEEVQACSLEA